ncbi:MAG: HK97 family phage prohead protease [Hyphomonas sp.]
MRDETKESWLIEGYASLFGQADSSGDRVRAGAFAQSLTRWPNVPMLIQHRDGARAGHWVRIVEDGRGLFVRGMVDSPGALHLIERGLDGLSIGFRPRMQAERTGGGRELIALDLFEISLVHAPMLEGARFSVLGRTMKRAA